MARSFGDVQKGPERSRIGRMIDAALDHVEVEDRYPKKRLSPSMFPICSVQEYAKQIYQRVHNKITGQSSTMLNIFAGSGTTMHATLQDALGHSGQFVGHWKCKNKSCPEHARTKSVYENGKRVKKGRYTRTRSTDNICPTCGKAMEYAELKILYKGMKGYVDGLIDNMDGTFSLMDLKSTMVSKAENGSFFVQYHKLQIMTYAYVLSRRYKYNIVDYTLVYVPRDNPKKFVEKSFKFDKREARKAFEFMMTQIDAWRAVMKSNEKNDPKYAIEHKPCKSEEYYWNEFHGYDTCPFVDVCFLDTHLYSRLMELEDKIRANPTFTYAQIIKPEKKRDQGLFAGKQFNKQKQLPQPKRRQI